MIKTISVLFCDECNEEIETVLDAPHLSPDKRLKSYGWFRPIIKKGDSKLSRLLISSFREGGYRYNELRIFCSENCKNKWCEKN